MKTRYIIIILFLQLAQAQHTIPNFVPLSQTTSGYNQIQLGVCTNGETIYSHGCVLTCQTMLLKLNGLNVDPIQTNNWLTNTLSNCLLSRGDLCNYPGSTINLDGSRVQINNSTISSGNFDRIKTSIDSNNPVIMRVRNNSHSVVIYGYNNQCSAYSDLIIANPSNLSPINPYYLDFYTNVGVSTKLINGGLDIYAGTPTSNGYTDVKTWCYPPNAQNPNSVSCIQSITDFKVNGFVKPLTALNQTLSNGKLQFSLNFNNIVTNTNNSPFDFEFTVNYTNSNNVATSQKFFGANQLYYLQVANFTDVIQTNDFYAYQSINVGIKNGLFKGTNQNGTWLFKPNDNLTKGQACKTIVSAMLRLNLIPGIDITNGPVLNMNSDSEMYKYAMTLYNFDNTILPTTTGTFDLSGTIKVEEFCYMIYKAFSIPANTNLGSKVTNVIYQSSNGNSFNIYLQRVGRIGVPKFDGLGNLLSADPLASFLPFTLTNSGSYLVDGTALLKRSTMAIFLTNAFLYKAYNNPGVTVYRTSNPTTQTQSTTLISDMKVIGDKFESTNEPTGVAPALNTSLQNNYTILDNQTITLTHPSSFDSANGGVPLYFYWTSTGGQSFTSSSSNYRNVVFTPGTVPTQTVFKIYSLVGNTNGKIREYIMTVTVNPVGSSSTILTPSQQANTVQLYGATSNSITANWTRGNGQNCIVTCYQVGANAQDVPDSGVVYVGNNNFSSAPYIYSGSDTKVVYTGTGTSCNISGLNPNTQYQIAVFEYNGITPSTVLYNLSNAPITVGSTLSTVNTVPSSNFIWNDTLTFQTGQPFTFTNTSQNSNIYQWSVSPSGSISNNTSATTTNVTFTTAGQYTLTLVATSSISGQTSTRTHNFYVYDATELLADLQPTNLNFISPMVGGQNLTITCNVANNSTASSPVISNVQFVLSTDQNFDDSDFTIGQEAIILNAGESTTISHIANNINNSFSGNYYILAKTDYVNGNSIGYVNESNENNNVISKSVVIQAALPDFVTLSLNPSPSIVSAGQVFTVSGTFRNIGSGDANTSPIVSLFISNDNILSTDDISLNYNINPNTGGNLQYANGPIISGSNSTVRLPFELPNGNYFLIGAIDYSLVGFGYSWNLNIETTENNNWLATPININSTTQPTINASNISISDVTSNSLKVNWTRGNGAGCVVLARANSDLPNKIVDGVSYIPDSNFTTAIGIQGYYTDNNGSMSIDNYPYVKLVYDGTSNFVNVTGLSPNETYSFIVLEYNGSGATKNYLQVSSMKGISAHTFGQNNSSSFKRLVGTIISGATSTVYSPSSIKFFTENNGIIFRNENGVGKTNDGGLTWVFQKNNIIERNKDSWLAGSSWLDNGFGWLGFENGNIIKTNDFGVSWTIKTLDRSIEDICFINQNTGFVALKSLINTTGNDGAIYKTIDGGVTWNSIGNFPRRISSVFFLNDQLGWATTFSSLTSENKIILKTTNGGNTWTQVIVTTPNQYAFITDIYFTDANNGFAMTLYGWLLKTTNGGDSWALNNIFNVTSSINSYSKIDFVNPQVGYINLLNQKIAKTTDGGLNWIINDIQNDYPTGSIATIDVLNENTLYVGGISGLLKSNTSGQSNSIVLNSLSQNSYCTGSIITIPYSIFGNYNASNLFIVELSDNIGNFANPTLLNTFNNPGNGNLTISIPNSIVTGNNYQIRVKTNDNITVSNILSNITINQSNTPIVIISTTNPVCSNSNIAFTSTGNYLGTTPIYQWFVNGISVGTNNSALNTSNLNNGDEVQVKVTSNDSCISQVVTYSNSLIMNIIQTPEVPLISQFDDILVSSSPENNQWYFNGIAIFGATNQFLQITQTGNYTVKVNSVPCLEVVSSIFNVNNLGSNEIHNNLGDSLVIYPNPFKDFLNIQTQNDKLQSVKLLDLQGRLIKQESISGDSYQLNLENLPQAVYILEIISDKGKQTVKVVKK